MTNSERTSSPRQLQETKDIERYQQSFSRIVNHLELDPLQKEFLESRWLDQVTWMERQANRFRGWHHRLQKIVVIGGVIIPALVSLTTLGGCSNLLKVEDSNQSSTDGSVSWLNVCDAGFSIGTFLVSQAVAICAASDQLFKYGERWRHYRRNVELLKSHGWQFVQLTGPYAAYAPQRNHQAAFRAFAGHIEEILQRDVELYINQIAEQQAQSQKTMENYVTELEKQLQAEKSPKQSDDRTSG